MVLYWLPGWYEPLVEPVAKDPRTITMPVIDIIDDVTLKYTTISASNVGTINLMTLTFDWMNRVNDENSASPFP